MIRINKPSQAPSRLLEQGKEQSRRDKISYSHSPNSYDTGSKKFEFKNNIYGHATVKEALIQAQHGKCCFCETIIFQEGDVEHFRPKKVVKQALGEAIEYPGYYWLAYDWQNLYLACKPCNQNYKKNLFPLLNPEARATNHRADLSAEQPSLIEPNQEEPTGFIGFRGASAYGMDPKDRGLKSIEILGLNRPQLRAARREKISDLKKEAQNLLKIIMLASSPNFAGNKDFQDAAEDAQKELVNLCLPSKSFSAAVDCAIADNFEYVI